MQDFNFSYDLENDDLFIFKPNTKSKGSVEFGNIILDFSSKQKLIGIQLIKASKILKDLINDKTESYIKKILEELTNCKIDIKENSNIMTIRFILSNSQKELEPTLSIPRITKYSLAFAYI
jgi:uncharacterized protein YuzE